RIIAATNTCLARQVEAGRFRRDLQYRLNALYLQLPPLRERDGDIALLAEHFLHAVAVRLRGSFKHWSEAAMRALEEYAWPGNVRELDNIALRAYMCSDDTVVGLADLAAAEPAFVGPRSQPRRRANEPEIGFRVAKTRAIHQFEHEYLVQLMQRASGNISAAARLSGTERRQLGKLLSSTASASSRSARNSGAGRRPGTGCGDTHGAGETGQHRPIVDRGVAASPRGRPLSPLPARGTPVASSSLAWRMHDLHARPGERMTLRGCCRRGRGRPTWINMKKRARPPCRAVRRWRLAPFATCSISPIDCRSA